MRKIMKIIILGFTISLLLASNAVYAQILGGNRDQFESNPPPAVVRPRTTTGEKAGRGTAGASVTTQTTAQPRAQVLTYGVGSQGQNQAAVKAEKESRYWRSYYGFRYDKNSIFLRDTVKNGNSGKQNQVTRNPNLRQSGTKTATTIGTTSGTANTGNASASMGGANSGSGASGTNAAGNTTANGTTAGGTGTGFGTTDSGTPPSPAPNAPVINSGGGATRNTPVPVNKGTAGSTAYGNPTTQGYSYQGNQSNGSPNYSGPYNGNFGYGNPNYGTSYGTSPYGSIGTGNPGFSGLTNGGPALGYPNGVISPSIGNAAVPAPGAGYPVIIGPSTGIPAGRLNSPGANALTDGTAGGSSAVVNPTRGSPGYIAPTAEKKKSGSKGTNKSGTDF